MVAREGSTVFMSTLGLILDEPIKKSLVYSGDMAAGSRCAALAISVERYRRARGQIPTTLNELVPACAKSLPQDPFTGKDLLYRHDARGFVVYSVGADGKDDGGNLVRPKNVSEPPDTGVRLNLPPGAR